MTSGKTIELDRSRCKDVLAVLTSLRGAIDAPDWHGWGSGATVGSMVGDGINVLAPPYTILVIGLEHAPADLIELVYVPTMH